MNGQLIREQLIAAEYAASPGDSRDVIDERVARALTVFRKHVIQLTVQLENLRLSHERRGLYPAALAYLGAAELTAWIDPEGLT